MRQPLMRPMLIPHQSPSVIHPRTHLDLPSNREGILGSKDRRAYDLRIHYALYLGREDITASIMTFITHAWKPVYSQGIRRGSKLDST